MAKKYTSITIYQLVNARLFVTGEIDINDKVVHLIMIVTGMVS